MKIAKFWKIIKSENMLFGQHQVLETRHNNKNRALAAHGFIEAKWTFLAKPVRFAQQDAIRVNRPQQQWLFLRKNISKIEQKQHSEFS